MASNHPKAFISYTHDDETQLERVLELANKLRKDGIDVILDQYESSPPQGWPKWMDQNIRKADFVLMICNKNYHQRIMDEEEDGKGFGIKWEGNLIYQHLYNSGSKSNKFIPILFDDEDKEYILIPLQGQTHYNINEGDQYEKLYWFLRGIPGTEKPELGKLRSLPKKEKKSLFIGGFIDIELWNKAQWGGVAITFAYDLKEPPTLCILFKEEKPAKKIIENWIKRLGDIDEYNELRISIIEGDIPGEHSGYTIHINANVPNIIKRSDEEGLNIPKDLFLIIGRIHRMEPSPDSKNLELFKQLYKRFGSYFIRMGVFDGKSVKIFEEPFLHKRDIELRNVKDILSKQDMDSIVLPKYRNK